MFQVIIILLSLTKLFNKFYLFQTNLVEYSLTPTEFTAEFSKTRTEFDFASYCKYLLYRTVIFILDEIKHLLPDIFIFNKFCIMFRNLKIDQ